jgi:hypothetical protein
MRRESHVRICERLGVKFPGPTRHGDVSSIDRDPWLQPSHSVVQRAWRHASPQQVGEREVSEGGIASGLWSGQGQ